MIQKLMFRLRSVNEDIELISILVFLIFFPEKSSFYYFLIFAILMIIFLLRKIIISKNIGISNFSKALLFVNFILLLSAVFSVYFLRSLLFFFDIFLISSYFILHLIEEREEERNFKIAGTIITLFSALTVFINIIFHQGDIFFSNPILSGITSGMGALIFLYRSLNRFTYSDLALILVNLISLFMSGSKAAFLGVVLISIMLVITKQKKLLPLILVLTALSLIIPNPVRNMFVYSLYKDPYSADRIKIWKTGLDIFRSNVFAGTGADNFSELSRKYNFRQEKGPANYFKLPRTPHSDYIKLISELGIWGMVILLFSLFFIFRRMVKGPLFDLSKALILYLLFQALFFNIIFKTFFFFMFIFLLKTLFKDDIEFHSNSRFFRFISTVVLVLVIFIGYISPYYSELLVKKASAGKTPGEILALLNRAETFNKMNISPYYIRAQMRLRQFIQSSDPGYFYSAVDDIQKIKRINRYYSKAYFLESDIFRSILDKGIQYPSLLEEILSPLEEIEKFDPFNPFIKMEKAATLLRFGRNEESRVQAQKALDLEPKFIGALYFLHKNFGGPEDRAEFEKRAGEILRSSSNWGKRNSPYLNALIKLPPELEYLRKN